MGFFQKHKFNIAIFIIILGAYFLLRVPNLTSQPIFADEAIYIRWAQVMKSEPTLRFLPSSDGKTPLFMWILIPLFKFIPDPLVAGRSLSILAGFFTLLGVFFLTKKVFNEKAGLWASVLYVITPYTVFFDRMALVDSMLCAFTIWGVYFAIWLAQKVRLDLAFILGFILGGGILTKTPGLLNLFLLPVSVLAFKRVKTDKNQLIKLFFFWGVAIVLALIMYNILRLGPNFHLLSSRNSDYIFSPFELKGRPLDPFIPHFHDISDWFPKLFTWPILIFGLLGVFNAVRDRNKLGWTVLLWALGPLLLNMAFLKTFTARYLLSFVPLFLIFGGYALERISKGFTFFIILAAILPLALRFDYQLIKNPPPDSLPKEERVGYFEDWTAGYGFKDIAGFLIEKKKNGPVVVGTEGFFGTLPDGLYIYLDKSNISVIGSNATISAQIRGSTRDHQTFFVGNKNKSLEGVEIIKEYPKVGGDATVLYKVLPLK